MATTTRRRSSSSSGWGRLPPVRGVRRDLAGASCWSRFVWLAGPFTLLVLFTVPVASEINAGNIQLLLAAAIVLGVPQRGAGWAGAWAFVLLTKVTPGVGLLWFALRRRWRALAIALGVTAAIAARHVRALARSLVRLVRPADRGGSPPPVAAVLPAVPGRGSLVAVAIVVVGGLARLALAGRRRRRRWPCRRSTRISPSMLVGVLPFLREARARAVERRRRPRECDDLRLRSVSRGCARKQFRDPMVFSMRDPHAPG